MIYDATTPCSVTVYFDAIRTPLRIRTASILHWRFLGNKGEAKCFSSSKTSTTNLELL